MKKKFPNIHLLSGGVPPVSIDCQKTLMRSSKNGESYAGAVDRTRDHSIVRIGCATTERLLAEAQLCPKSQDLKISIRMASSSSSTPSVERSCLCGTVNACSPSSQQHTSRSSNSNTAKCKICRTKPKFCFLRGQRSLDLGQQGPSSAGLNGHVVSTPPARSAAVLSKEAEAIRDSSRAPSQGRRARSAERYEGLRVHERTAPGLPRQTSLQTPMISNISASGDRPPEYVYPELPPISSPPPTYEVAMGKGHPPSYEEYLAQRLTQQQLTPPPLPPRNPNMPSRNSTPPPPWTQQQQQVTSPVLASPTSSISSHAMQQQNFCNCSKCKNGSIVGVRGGGLMVNLPRQEDGTPSRGLADAQRQLRVMLPPEISQQSMSSSSSSSHDHCPCSKCQSRYGTYNDSNGNNDLMFSLDSTPAIQGVLSDGLLCSVM